MRRTPGLPYLCGRFARTAPRGTTPPKRPAQHPARARVTREHPCVPAPCLRRITHVRFPSALCADHRPAHHRHRGLGRSDLLGPRIGGDRPRGLRRTALVRREAEDRRRGQLPCLHWHPHRPVVDRHRRELLRRHARYSGSGRQARAEDDRDAQRRQRGRGHRDCTAHRPRRCPGTAGHCRHGDQTCYPRHRRAGRQRRADRRRVWPDQDRVGHR